MRDTRGTLTQLGKDISGLNASIAKLQKQQSAQQNLLAKQLDAAFRQGQHSAVQLILSGEESQRSERILAYFGYLNEARQKTIEELKQTRAELAKQNHAGGQTGPAKILTGRATDAAAKLEQARGARKKTLTALEASLEKINNARWNCARTKPACATRSLGRSAKPVRAPNAKRVKRPGARTGAHQGAAGEENRHDLQT